MLKPSARLFPIGFIISVDASNFNPHDFYVGGNWERIKGRVIVGLDENQTEFNTTGKTGGAKTHTLSVSEMPEHRHKVRYVGGNANGIYGGQPGTSKDATSAYNSLILAPEGGGQAHNNLQPYQTAYVWKLISYSN